MAMVSEHRTDMKPMAKKRPKTMVVDSSSDGWSSDGSFAPHPTRQNVYVHRFRRRHPYAFAEDSTEPRDPHAGNINHAAVQIAMP